MARILRGEQIAGVGVLTGFLGVTGRQIDLREYLFGQHGLFRPLWAGHWLRHEPSVRSFIPREPHLISELALFLREDWARLRAFVASLFVTPPGPGLAD